MIQNSPCRYQIRSSTKSNRSTKSLVHQIWFGISNTQRRETMAIGSMGLGQTMEMALLQNSLKSYDRERHGRRIPRNCYMDEEPFHRSLWCSRSTLTKVS